MGRFGGNDDLSRGVVCARDNGCKKDVGCVMVLGSERDCCSDMVSGAVVRLVL